MLQLVEKTELFFLLFARLRDLLQCRRTIDGICFSIFGKKNPSVIHNGNFVYKNIITFIG